MRHLISAIISGGMVLVFILMLLLLSFTYGERSAMRPHRNWQLLIGSEPDSMGYRQPKLILGNYGDTGNQRPYFMGSGTYRQYDAVENWSAIRIDSARKPIVRPDGDAWVITFGR